MKSRGYHLRCKIGRNERFVRQRHHFRIGDQYFDLTPVYIVGLHVDDRALTNALNLERLKIYTVYIKQIIIVLRVDNFVNLVAYQRLIFIAKYRNIRSDLLFVQFGDLHNNGNLDRASERNQSLGHWASVNNHQQFFKLVELSLTACGLVLGDSIGPCTNGVSLLHRIASVAPLSKLQTMY